MVRITKKPTHDGTYTVYCEGVVVQCGLTRSGADRLIERLCSLAMKGSASFH